MSAPEGTLVKEYQVTGVDGTIYTFEVWLTKVKTGEEPPSPPPPPPPTDLEEISIVSATSNRDDGNVASNVIKQDTARWSCQGTDCELLLDLGHVNEVGQVFITFFRGAERTERFEVGFSQDNVKYVLVSETQQDAANAIVKISPLIKARYVKFLGKGNDVNDWNSVEYVKVSGKKLPAPPPPEPCPPQPCPDGEHWDQTLCKCVPNEPEPGPEPGPGPDSEAPYTVIGEPMQSTTRGPTTRHYRSGKPDDNTIEKNVKSIKFKNYQFVVDITNDCQWAHDDTFSMKLGGTHMGSGWFDHGLGVYDGQCCLGTEKKHPSTQLCVVKGPKVGDTRGKRFKLACTYFTDKNHTELWTNFGNGGWKKQVEGTNVNNFNPKSSEDEAQLRIDGFKTKSDPPTIHSATVTEIAATGSTTTAATAETAAASTSNSKDKPIECGTN